MSVDERIEQSNLSLRVGVSDLAELFADKKRNQSPTVMVRRLRWTLSIFTTKWKDGKNYLSVSLQCSSGSKESLSWKCKSKSTISLKSQLGQPKDDYGKTYEHVFTRKKPSYKISRFYEYEALMNPASGFVLGNRIIIQVEASPFIPQYYHYKQKLGILENYPFAFKSPGASSTALHFLETGTGSDVTIVSSDKAEFKVHRGIFEGKSVVFERMFDTDMSEAKRRVLEWKDMDGPSVTALLRFLYLGDISLVEEAGVTGIQQLINASEKYELEDLKKYCGYLLVERVSTKNAMDLFKFARQFGLAEEAMEVFKFAQSNFKSVWKHIAKGGNYKVSEWAPMIAATGSDEGDESDDDDGQELARKRMRIE